jgi:hypothetical protein
MEHTLLYSTSVSQKILRSRETLNIRNWKKGEIPEIKEYIEPENQ